MKKPQPQLKHPQDPEYDDSYDYEEELAMWEEYCEERAEEERMRD